MERVTGIGGFFFRSRNPDGLRQWYAQHLGITPAPRSDGELPWAQEGGFTVFEPFPHDSTYFKTGWMLNLRVRNLNAMLTQLRAAGIEIVDVQDYPYGRFAHLHDPEGNPLELWEPPAT